MKKTFKLKKYNNDFLCYNNNIYINKNFLLFLNKNNSLSLLFNFINLFTKIKINRLKYLYFFKKKKVLLFVFCSFVYSRIFLKVGLGFRKKYSKFKNSFGVRIGRRKWVHFKVFPSSFFFNMRRKNMYMFFNTKRKLYSCLVHLKYMRKETLFKVKGIMTFIRIKFNRRICRSMLFARRVKFKRMKLKLTKKQKQKR